ncbi:hypothetical protein BH10PSE7_BH10PSE7_10570 [soil metagenome]
MPQLSEQPFLHEDATVLSSQLGRYVEIGKGSRIIESVFDDYSYADRYADVAYSTLGKFAKIAAFSRINPSEHPDERASLHHFMYWSHCYWPDEPDEQAVFDWRRSRGAVIGHVLATGILSHRDYYSGLASRAWRPARDDPA